MAVVANPITLGSSMLTSSITQMLNYMRVQSRINISPILTNIIDLARDANIEIGAGRTYTAEMEQTTVNTYSRTSTAFDITQIDLVQETIMIDTYKFITQSVNEVFTRDAVTSQSIIQSVISLFLGIINKTFTNYIYNEVMDTYNTFIAARVAAASTDLVTVDTTEVSTLTGTELNDTRRANANAIFRAIRNQFFNMILPTTNYTQPVGTATTSNVTQIGSRDELTLLLNSKYAIDMDIDSLAVAFNMDKVEGRLGEFRIVTVPEPSLTTANFIGMLQARHKVVLADFYRVMLSIVDPSTMFTNMFFHFAYVVGVLNQVPACIFVENAVAPTT